MLCSVRSLLTGDIGVSSVYIKLRIQNGPLRSFEGNLNPPIYLTEASISFQSNIRFRTFIELFDL